MLAFARAGRAERAKELRAEYLAEADSVIRVNEQPFAIHAMDGEIAMAEGRYADAVVAYRTARSRNACPICYVAELANAFDKAGVADSAAAYYEQFLTTPQLGRVGSDATSRPASLRRLGELYDRAGDLELALDYYSDFVELWAEADPFLQPQVQEVRQRMAELAGEPD